MHLVSAIIDAIRNPGLYRVSHQSILGFGGHGFPPALWSTSRWQCQQPPVRFLRPHP